MTTMTDSEALAVLDEVSDYIAERADVKDGDYGQPEPNTEMTLHAELRQARAHISEALRDAERWRNKPRVFDQLPNGWTVWHDKETIAGHRMDAMVFRGPKRVGGGIFYFANADSPHVADVTLYEIGKALLASASTTEGVNP